MFSHMKLHYMNLYAEPLKMKFNYTVTGIYRSSTTLNLSSSVLVDKKFENSFLRVFIAMFFFKISLVPIDAF